MRNVSRLAAGSRRSLLPALVLAAALSLAASATASVVNVRPDDRGGVRGPGAKESAVVRPDDRGGVRGASDSALAEGSGLASGSYRVSYLVSDLPGVGSALTRETLGEWTLRLYRGEWRLSHRPAAGIRYPVVTGTYARTGSRVVFRTLTPAAYAAGVSVFTWTADGPLLRFSRVAGFPGRDLKLVWTTGTWRTG